MGKIKAFFGLEAKETQTEKLEAQNSFNTAFVSFIALSVLIPLTLILYWPYPSTEPIWVSAYDINSGQAHTLETAELPIHILAFAWVKHFLPTAIVTMFCIQMVRVSSAFNRRENFSFHAIRIFKQVRWILSIGLIIYLIDQMVLDTLVQNYFAGHDRVSVSRYSSDWFELGIVVAISVVYFIEGALRRGLTLQEEADATI